MTNDIKCPVCSSSDSFSHNVGELPQVRSDDQVALTKIEILRECNRCRIIFTEMTETWRESCQVIYESYSVHSLSDGKPPKIYSETNFSVSRNSKILELVSNRINLDNKSSWLDYGCGSGDFLLETGSKFPNLNLYGVELKIQPILHLLNKSAIKGIASIDSAQELGKSEIVSLIHVLEHLERPSDTLQKIKRVLLKTDGVLVVAVPNVVENPFDLCIYDHALHFEPQTLVNLLVKNGFNVIEIKTDSIIGEILVIATPFSKESTLHSLDSIYFQQDVTFELESKRLNNTLQYLYSVKNLIEAELAHEQKIIIFGTGISAIWALQIVGANRVVAWADEDRDRVGKEMAGINVIHPDQIDRDGIVLICMSRLKANNLRARSQTWKFRTFWAVI